MLKHAVMSGLVAGGSDVVDVGISATPTIQLAVEELGAAGGIAVTASHNPEEWNALKFVSSTGTFLTDAEGRQLLKLYKKGPISYAGHREIGHVSQDAGASARHVSRILELNYVDKARIVQRKFRVAVDCCNGAGCDAVKLLVNSLGCEVHEIFCEPTGVFPRGPEPVTENLSVLSDAVCREGLDAGFAFDPDADRMSLVSEKGNPLGEERTVCLSTAFALGKKVGPVCTNVSTTAAMDDIAAAFGSKLYRSKVGEAHVVEKMKRTGSVVGGEGNGGAIFPALHYARDGIMALAVILQFMAQTGRKLSELDRLFPKYHMVKRKIDAGGVTTEGIKEILLNRFKDGSINYTDGIRISWPGKWLHVRKSRTEPVVRVIVESSSMDDAASFAEEVLTLVRAARA